MYKDLAALTEYLKPEPYNLNLPHFQIHIRSIGKDWTDLTGKFGFIDCRLQQAIEHSFGWL